MHAWVAKIIQEELYKRLKFDYTAKWYIYKSECVQENQIN